MKKFACIFLYYLFLQGLQAQNIYQLHFRFEPNDAILEKQYTGFRSIDSSRVNQELSQVLLRAWSQSYLLAAEKIRKLNSDTLEIEINLGNSFQLKQIFSGNVPAEWLNNSGSALNRMRKGKYATEELGKEMRKILSYAENNGYPFAQISLDSFLIENNQVTATLHLEKNKLIYFDSLDFGGTAKISKSFLMNYANIKPGMVYQEDLIKKLDSRLSELSYIQVVRPLGIYFYGNKAKPYVYIDHKKASSFDGVIGFAPNSQINNKLVISGDLNLKLANLLGSGKNLELAYRGFLNNSQDLQVKCMWPYFLNTRLAIDYSFKLLKFDTTWIELFNDIGLQYRFSGNNYVKVYYQNQQISLFNTDTQSVLNTKKLPAIHDVRNDFYGMGVRRSTLNYFYNPSKGYLLEIEAGIGNKRLIKNSTLNQLEIVGNNGSRFHIYDSVKLNTLQYKCSGNFMVFNKLSTHFVLLTQLKGAVLVNENLFMNELFRIGGLKTLKGFDEQSIFANRYLIANMEIRYLFPQNSGFLLFWNGAWYKNEVAAMKVSDRPWGVGAGMNLETGAGIFSLYYAMGTQKGNPLEYQRAKIHFGLVNFF